MNKKQDTTRKDAHYARLRRTYRKSKISKTISKNVGYPAIFAEKNEIYLYGTHTVAAALNNKNRRIKKLLLTKNALEKIKNHASIAKIELEIVETRILNNLLNNMAIHQGIVAIVDPLRKKTIEDLKNAKSIVLLDQITDPHNIGAIMRSCVAFNVDALITTSRHSASETSTLAKSASGALDMIEYITATNLCNVLLNLHNLGFTSVGLDSEGSDALDEIFNRQKIHKIAFVLGAEGKGLRESTRETINYLARLSIPGKIKSLNVSNAAAIALHILHKHMTIE